MLEEVDMVRLSPSKRGNASLIGVDVVKDVIMFKKGRSFLIFHDLHKIPNIGLRGPLTGSDKYEEGKIDQCFYIIHSLSISN